MIWVVFGVVSLVALAPLLLGLIQPVAERRRRDAALALYRAQLD
ncbi:MAG: hypothetical protein POG24_08410 [Acidocella sp.]|nr:hypothetical protein [Acidocella sp.]